MATSANPPEQHPTPNNMTMMQAFEWYVPADHAHWKRLKGQMKQLKEYGIDNLWIPPGCKASSQEGNGYDIYDLYDLGEFDQKGGKGTKWGTKEELLDMVKEATDVGCGIYWRVLCTFTSGLQSTNTQQGCSAQPQSCS